MNKTVQYEASALGVANMLLMCYQSMHGGHKPSLRTAVHALKRAFDSSAGLFNEGDFVQFAKDGLFEGTSVRRVHLGKDVHIEVFDLLLRAADMMQVHGSVMNSASVFYQNQSAWGLAEGLTKFVLWEDLIQPEQTDIAKLSQAALQTAGRIRKILIWAMTDSSRQTQVDTFWRNEQRDYYISPAYLTLVRNAHDTYLANRVDPTASPSQQPVVNAPQPEGSDRALFKTLAQMQANGGSGVLPPAQTEALVEANETIQARADAIDHFVDSTVVPDSIQREEVRAEVKQHFNAKSPLTTSTIMQNSDNQPTSATQSMPAVINKHLVHDLKLALGWQTDGEGQVIVPNVLLRRDVMAALTKISNETQVNGATIIAMAVGDLQAELDAANQVNTNVGLISALNTVLDTFRTYDLLRESLQMESRLMHPPGLAVNLVRLAKFMEDTIAKTGDELYKDIEALLAQMLKRNVNGLYSVSGEQSKELDSVLNDNSTFNIGVHLRNAIRGAVAVTLTLPARAASGTVNAAHDFSVQTEKAAEAATPTEQELAAARADLESAGMQTVDLIQLDDVGKCTNTDAILKHWGQMTAEQRSAYWAIHTPEQRLAFVMQAQFYVLNSPADSYAWDNFVAQVEACGGVNAPTVTPGAPEPTIRMTERIELDTNNLCTNYRAVYDDWSKMPVEARAGYWLAHTRRQREAFVAAVCLDPKVRMDAIDLFMAQVEAAGGLTAPTKLPPEVEQPQLDTHEADLAELQSQLVEGRPQDAPAISDPTPVGGHKPFPDSGPIEEPAPTGGIGAVVGRFYRDERTGAHRDAEVFPVQIPGLTYQPDMHWDFEHTSRWGVEQIEAGNVPCAILSTIRGPGGVTIDVVVGVGKTRTVGHEGHYVISVNLVEGQLDADSLGLSGYLANPGVDPEPEVTAAAQMTDTLEQVAASSLEPKERVVLATALYDFESDHTLYTFEFGEPYKHIVDDDSLAHVMFWVRALNETGETKHLTTMETREGDVIDVVVNVDYKVDSDGDRSAMVVISEAREGDRDEFELLHIPQPPDNLQEMLTATSTDQIAVIVVDKSGETMNVVYATERFPGTQFLPSQFEHIVKYLVGAFQHNGVNIGSQSTVGEHTVRVEADFQQKSDGTLQLVAFVSLEAVSTNPDDQARFQHDIPIIGLDGGVTVTHAPEDADQADVLEKIFPDTEPASRELLSTVVQAQDIPTSKGSLDDVMVAQLEMDLYGNVGNLLVGDVTVNGISAPATLQDLEPITKWVAAHYQANPGAISVIENFSLRIGDLACEVMVNVYVSRHSTVESMLDVSVQRIDRVVAAPADWNAELNWKQPSTAPTTVAGIAAQADARHGADTVHPLPVLGEIAESARDRLRQAGMVATGLVNPATQPTLQEKQEHATELKVEATLGDHLEELMHWLVDWISKDSTLRGPRIDRKVTAKLHQLLLPIVSALPEYSYSVTGELVPDDHHSLFAAVLSAAEVADNSRESVLRNSEFLTWLNTYIFQQRVLISGELAKARKKAQQSTAADPSINQ